MVKAVFLDFYGTVVHEDGEIIKKLQILLWRQAVLMIEVK